MSKKLSTILYGIARKTARSASKINDIERLAKGDIKGLAKKKIRKETYKQTNKIARKISKPFK